MTQLLAVLREPLDSREAIVRRRAGLSARRGMLSAQGSIPYTCTWIRIRLARRRSGVGQSFGRAAHGMGGAD